MIVGTAIVMAAAGVLLWAPFAMSGTSSPTEVAHDNSVLSANHTPAGSPAGDSGSATPHSLADGDVQPLNEVRDKQGCYHRFGNYVWVYCNYRDYVAGIDYDNNEDTIGGVYCCPL